MNEQLQAKLVEILSGIQAAAKAGGDFALSQLPDIAQSYVAYGRAVALFSIVACLAAAVFFGWVAVAYGFRGKQPDTYGSWAESRIVASMFGSFLSLVGGISFFAAVIQGSLVWFAPKVWLLRELASLVK